MTIINNNSSIYYINTDTNINTNPCIDINNINTGISA